MTTDEAKSRISSLVAADQEPALSDDEVSALEVGARRVDVAGLSVTDPNWVPTWDFNAAAAEGWRIKAGKCSPAFDIQADQQRLSRAQMFSHCLEMARTYANRRVGNITVGAQGAVEVTASE